jgi:hypothetical protein
VGGEDILIIRSLPGFLPLGRHRAYIHVLAAVSMNAEEMLERTVERELNDVSRNIAWDWILNASAKSVSGGDIKIRASEKTHSRPCDGKSFPASSKILQ